MSDIYKKIISKKEINNISLYNNKLSFYSLFFIFLRLGTTSFGGPIAHFGYFREEFIHRRKWLSEHDFADLISLCQFLPGPASSQVGIAIGTKYRGIIGGVVAWLGFTLPSAIFFVLFSYGMAHFDRLLGTGWLHGLKIVAVAVVAQALLAMTRSLCPDFSRALFAGISTLVAIAFPSPITQISIIILGGGFGWALLHKKSTSPHHFTCTKQISRTSGFIVLAAFLGLLILLPLLAKISQNSAVQQFAIFYKAGALVFGGGHVILPLLQAEIIPNGWISNDVFLAGYGAAQAVPGPLFSFAAYLGASSKVQPSGWLGGAMCLVAIFLPGFLLIVGILPFWERLRSYKSMQSAMQGINASVVGLLLASFYHPVWSSAIHSWKDLTVSVVAFLLLAIWRIPSWLVVIMSAVTGYFII